MLLSKLRYLSTTSYNTILKNMAYSQNKMKRPFTIIVEGNIGSGKTLFINNFQRSKNVLAVLEPVEKWRNVGGHDLLSLMYNDLHTWAFIFQTYVQVTMMKNHELKTDKPVKLMERSIYSSRYIFVENLNNSNILKGAQAAVLDEWFNWIVKKVEFSVDLIVYLRTEPEVVFERIKARNRKGEEAITLDYLKTLHQCHEDWLLNKTKFSCPAPVIVLDANKNLEDIQEEYSHFKSQVEMLSSNVL